MNTNTEEIMEQINLLDNLIMPEEEDEENDHYVFTIIYGVAEGKVGFHIVCESYPDYFISFLGETFEAAQEKILAEWQE